MKQWKTGGTKAAQGNYESHRNIFLRQNIPANTHKQY